MMYDSLLLKKQKCFESTGLSFPEYRKRFHVFVLILFLVINIIDKLKKSSCPGNKIFFIG